MTDVVYILKEAEVNEELRYSLRSVAENWPWADIVVVGYKPSWVTGVEYIPVEQIRGQKHPNSLRNQRTALTSLTISDPYWHMNDDFFVLQPSTNSRPTIYHWGTIDHVLSTYGPKGLGSSYYNSMVATRDVLYTLGHTSPMSYAAHVPLIIHKAPMLDALYKYNQAGVWIQHATIYGNEYGLGGTQLPNGDVKVYATDSRAVPSWVKTSEFVSTMDMSFARGRIGRWIRQRFPNPCRFEADA